nr:flavin reductase [Nocardioides sp. zg-DK7169]
MAQWPSGVTVVTTLAADGSRIGMTASSFSSVSATPALVSICLDRKLYTHDQIAQAGCFGINVLAKDQIEVGRRFAGMVKDCPDRFAGEEWSTAETGVALLDSALGWLDCRVVHQYDGGDHTIFVGEVLAANAARRSAPLLYHARGWGQFADVLPEVATLADGGAVQALRERGEDPASIAAVVAALADAGIRVRVLDLTDAGSGPDAQDTQAALAAVPGDVDLATTTARVGDRLQAEQALGLGIGTVEVVADLGTDPDAALARALATIEGVEDRAAVTLLDPFDPARAESVIAAVVALADRGVREVCLPDTDGRATALEVRALLSEVTRLARPTSLRMALHDRDRLGLVKALTALKSGVTHFDTTLGGLDGAVASEDLVRLLETLDVTTPADPHTLSGLAQQLRGESTSGLLGPEPVADRPELAPGTSTPDTVGAAG